MLKVTNKISKMGKDPKWIYNQFDKDGDGTRKYTLHVILISLFAILVDADEILQGIRSVLGIFFSKDETRDFTDHLDEDKSGDIDRHEFCQKVNLDNLHKESHGFLISELTFIEKVLNEWYYFKKREQKKILDLIAEYDEN